MRILHVINSLTSGGAEKLLVDLLPLMHNETNQVYLLLLQTKNSVFIERLKQEGVIIHTLSYNKIYSLITLVKLVFFFKRNKFNIIHSHIFPSFYFVAFASYFVSNTTKFFYTEHSTNNKRRDNKLFRLLDKWAYKRYSAIIGVSQRATLNLNNSFEFKVDNPIIRTIQNGINLSVYDKPFDNQMYLSLFPNNCVPITMVARFTEAKDHETLIQSLLFLPDFIHLYLVGEGQLVDNIQAFVLNLNLGDRVHFLGFREDIPNILRMSKIGILSSNWEGLPLSAIEVMASSIPFIGSNVPGIKELVNSLPENSAILFEHKNCEDLASKISTLLNNKEYYDLVSKNGKLASRLFSSDIMVKEYLKLYNECLCVNI